MNFLVLGDIFPCNISSNERATDNHQKNKIEFVVANGENAAKNGLE